MQYVLARDMGEARMRSNKGGKKESPTRPGTETRVDHMGIVEPIPNDCRGCCWAHSTILGKQYLKFVWRLCSVHGKLRGRFEPA